MNKPFSFAALTGALVTVLSVMSGFEQDLKGKILGTHAHMIVTTPDRSFSDYREALGAIEADPGVVAATPYLSGEVMLTSQSNLAGVILKGIDPKTGRMTGNFPQGYSHVALVNSGMLLARTWGERAPPVGDDEP